MFAPRGGAPRPATPPSGPAATPPPAGGAPTSAPPVSQALQRERELMDHLKKRESELQTLKQQLDQESQQAKTFHEELIRVQTKMEEIEQRSKQAFYEREQQLKSEREALMRKLSSRDDENALLRSELAKKEAEILDRLSEAQSSWEKRESDLQAIQDRAIQELKGLERKLQEERERAWSHSLHAKDEEINALKVELTLTETRVRALMERKELELREAEEEKHHLLQERETHLNEEKERWLSLLKTKDDEYHALKAELGRQESVWRQQVEEKEDEVRQALARTETELREQERRLWDERESWVKMLKDHLAVKEQEAKAAMAQREEALKAQELKLGEYRHQVDFKFEEYKQQVDLAFKRKAEELDLTMKKKDDEINHLRVQVALKDAEVHRAHEEREVSLRQREQETQQRIAEAERTWQKEREGWMAQLAAKDQLIEQIRGEIAKRLEEERYIWSERLKNKDQEITAVRQDVATAKAHLDEAESRWSLQLTVKEDTLRVKEQEVKDLKHRVNDVAVEWERRLADERVLWEKQLEQARQETAGVKALLAEYKSDSPALIAQKERELTTLHQQFEESKLRWQSELAAKDRRSLEAVQEIKGTLDTRESELRAEIERRKAIERELAKVTTLEGHLSDLQRQLMTANHEMEILRRHGPPEMQAQLADQSAKALKMEGQLKNELERRAILEAELRTAMEELRTLQHSWSTRDAQFKADLATAERALADQTGKRQMSEEQIVALRKEVEGMEAAFKRDLEAFEDTLRRKDEEYVKLQALVAEERAHWQRQSSDTARNLSEAQRLLGATKREAEDAVMALKKHLTDNETLYKLREQEVMTLKRQLTQLAQERTRVEQERHELNVRVALAEQEFKLLLRRSHFWLWLTGPFIKKDNKKGR